MNLLKQEQEMLDKAVEMGNGIRLANVHGVSNQAESGHWYTLLLPKHTGNPMHISPLKRQVVK